MGFEFARVFELLFVIVLGPILVESFKRYKESKLPKKTLYSPTIAEKSDPIMAPIMDKFSPLYVCFWEAENGDNTISGHSFLKLSVGHEILGYDSRGDKVQSIKADSQKVPIDNFGRNIAAMKKNVDRDYCSHECEKDDALANYHKAFNISTIYAFKTYTKSGWTGILIVAFENKTELTDPQIEWLNVQCSKLDNLHV